MGDTVNKKHLSIEELLGQWRLSFKQDTVIYNNLKLTLISMTNKVVMSILDKFYLLVGMYIVSFKQQTWKESVG